MTTRKLAVALALNRIQFGLGLVLTPERNAAVWVGRKAAKREPAKVLAQALGARDLVLGIGGLLALRGGPQQARPWFAAQAVADGGDVAGMLLAGDEIPAVSRAMTFAIAAASTAIAVAYTASPE